MTPKQLDSAIHYLLDEVKKYTDVASPKGDEAAYTINMTSAMILSSIAGALIAARAETPHFHRNEEEEGED